MARALNVVTPRNTVHEQVRDLFTRPPPRRPPTEDPAQRTARTDDAPALEPRPDSGAKRPE